MDHWKILELEPTQNKRDIKRAYAKRVKQSSPETDPEGYQTVREAYEWALEYADRCASPSVSAHTEMFDEPDQPSEPWSSNVDHVEPAETAPTDPVDQVVEAFTQALETDKDADNDYETCRSVINNAVSTDDLAAIDARYRLEGEIAQALCWHPEANLELWQFIARSFGWRVGIDRAPDTDNPFADKDSLYFYAYDQCTWRYWREQALRDAFKDVHISEPDRVEINKFLFDGDLELGQQILNRREDLKHAIKCITKNIAENEFQERGIFPIDADVERRLRRIFGIDTTAESRDNSQSSGYGMSMGVVIFLIWIVFKMISVVMDDNKYDYTSPDEIRARIEQRFQAPPLLKQRELEMKEELDREYFKRPNFDAQYSNDESTNKDDSDEDQKN